MDQKCYKGINLFENNSRLNKFIYDFMFILTQWIYIVNVNGLL